MGIFKRYFKPVFVKHREWMLPAFSGFVATVLGIAVTLGVSKVIDYKNYHSVQRQCVYNVLSDIDIALDFIQRDSTTMADLKWMNDYLVSRASGQAYSEDSLCDLFFNLSAAPSFFRSYYTTAGRNIMSGIPPANEMDMQLHRDMEQVYKLLDRLQETADFVDQNLDTLLVLRLRLIFTSTNYSDKQVAETVLETDAVRSLGNLAFHVNGVDYYSKFRRELERLRGSILDISGVTMEEYEVFCESVEAQRSDTTQQHIK